MPDVVRTAALAVVLAAICVGSSQAARPVGPPWPGGTIRYFNAATDQSWAVTRAVNAWNSSGARVRFVATSPHRADLIIQHYYGRNCHSSGTSAKATVGYVGQRRARIYLSPLDESSLGCNRYAAATFAAHELGHVLGLGHENRGCAVMNSSASMFGASKCPASSIFEWRCRLLTTDDIRGAIRLYGGRPRPRPGPETCRFYTPIAAPAGFSATYRADQSGVRLSFRRPPAPTLPPFFQRLLDQADPGAQREGYALTSRAGTCPTNQDLRAARPGQWAATTTGATIEIADRLPSPGRYCYAVWAFDRAGWPSERPATAWVDVPSPGT